MEIKSIMTLLLMYQPNSDTVIGTINSELDCIY